MHGDPEPSPSRRVAVLIDLLSGGGAERVAVDLAGHLDPRRYRAELLVTRHTGPLESVARAYGLRPTILDRKRGFSPRKLARAVRLVRSCDLLHSHKFAGSCWGVLIARLARRPLVAHEHSAYGDVRSWRRTLLYRHWIAPYAQTIICVSPDIADSLERLGVSRSRLTTVRNGVATDVEHTPVDARAELGLDPTSPVVGIIGRLRHEKRHDILLRAAAQLRDAGRHFTVCIVGDGPELPALRALESELELEDVIVWAGERDNAGRLASAFTIAVLCSDFEGLPLAALEALASGVPLVATAVGALPDLLGGGAGITVPTSDSRALAEALAELLDDPERCQAMGARGQAVVAADFSLERSVTELEGVYDKVFA